MIGSLRRRASRLARGLAVAAAASIAVHAGLAAWALLDRAGAASTPLPYMRTRIVVAAETAATQAMPAAEARVSDAEGEAPPPPSPAKPPSAEEAEATEARPPSSLQTTPATTAPSQPPTSAAPAGEAAPATPPATAAAQPPAQAPEPRRDPSPAPPAAAQLPVASPMPISVAQPAAAPLTGASPDPGPELLSDLYIDRPSTAGRRGGSVTLRLVLSPQGSVAQATVLHSEPPGLFDAATLKALATARFRPALRGGVAISAETIYEVEIPPVP